MPQSPAPEQPEEFPELKFCFCPPKSEIERLQRNNGLLVHVMRLQRLHIEHLAARLAAAESALNAWQMFVNKQTSVVMPERMTREYYAAIDAAKTEVKK